MPQFHGSDGFEYDLEVGSYSVEGGDFRVEDHNLLQESEDAKIGTLRFTLNLCAIVRSFTMMMAVRLKVRAVDEATWTVRFTGYLQEAVRDSKKQTVQCVALGREYLLKAKFVPFAHYGNEFVEDQSLPITWVAGVIPTPKVTLDATGPLQMPASMARVHNGENGNVYGVAGSGLVFKVYNEGNAGVNRFGDACVPFMHEGGKLYGVCLNLTMSAQCSEDLVVTIEGCTSSVDLTPNGNVVLSADMSAGDYTSAGWYYFSFDPADNLELDPGPYVIHLQQAVGNLNSTSLTPFWKLNSGMNGFRLAHGFRKTELLNWAIDLANFPLHMPNSEGNYTELSYGKGYEYEGNSIVKIKTGNAYNSWAQKVKNLGDCPLTRWSYWKGDMDYSSTLEDMCQDFGSEFYDVLDIDITQPVSPVQCIVMKDTTPWDALVELRKFTAIHWKFAEGVSGTITLSIRNKLEAADWAGQAAAWKAARTFKHGDDGASEGECRIASDKLGKYLEGVANCCVAASEIGKYQYSEDEVITGDLGDFSFVIAVGLGLGGGFGTGGYGPGEMGGMGNFTYGQMRTATKRGEVELLDADFSTSSALFLDTNELVYIVDSDMGFDGAYVVTKMSIDWGHGGKVKLEIADKSMTYFIPSTLGFPQGITTRDVKMAKMPTSQAPMVPTDLGEFQAANETVLCRPEVFGEVYDPSQTYQIGIGIGTPAGPNLGDTVAEMTATVMTQDDGSVILMAEFCERDLISGHSTPLQVTEINIQDGSGPKAARSIGTPKDGGSFEITHRRPEIRKYAGKITIFVHMRSA